MIHKDNGTSQLVFGVDDINRGRWFRSELRLDESNQRQTDQHANNAQPCTLPRAEVGFSSGRAFPQKSVITFPSLSLNRSRYLDGGKDSVLSITLAVATS